MLKIGEVAVWLGYSIVGNNSYRDEILEMAVDSVKEHIDVLGFSGQAGWRGLDVFTWIRLRLSYCHDNYVRHVSPVTLDAAVSRQVWMLPNETLSVGCGDCDDLALPAYAAMKATQKPGEHVFILLIYPGEGPGHAGVLVVAGGPDGRKEYYVLDPAGNYYNGLNLFMEFTLVAPNGTEMYTYISPLTLSHEQKIRLRNIYTLVYYDWVEDKTYTYDTVQIWYYTEANAALHDWIIEYWGIDSVDTIIVWDIGVWKEFRTITDAAQWIEHNT